MIHCVRLHIVGVNMEYILIGNALVAFALLDIWGEYIWEGLEREGKD